MRIIAVALFAVFATACGDPNVKKLNTVVTIRPGVSKEAYEWNYKGHAYIIIGDGDSGYSITHAGHCPCGRR